MLTSCEHKCVFRGKQSIFTLIFMSKIVAHKQCEHMHFCNQIQSGIASSKSEQVLEKLPVQNMLYAVKHKLKT